MDFLDLILEIAKDHSESWKKNNGKDGHTDFIDGFAEPFSKYKKAIDDFFDQKETESKPKH